LWHWPWDDGLLSWLGWPVIIAFAACFGLARVIGEFFQDWPGLDAPNPQRPSDTTPDRPLTLRDTAALGVGVAALLLFGWVVAHSSAR
jgi:hypothetical protein